MTTKGVKDEGENEDKETVARAADGLVTFLSFCVYFCKKIRLLLRFLFA